MFGKLFVWCLLTLMNSFEKWELLAKKENLSAELRANDIDIYHVTGSMIKAFYIPLPLILPKDPMSDLHHHPTLQWEPGVRDILWLFQGHAVNRSDRNKRWLWPSKEVKRGERSETRAWGSWSGRDLGEERSWTCPPPHNTSLTELGLGHKCFLGSKMRWLSYVIPKVRFWLENCMM